ncbi:MAG: SurA N-terminal domain-containing protein [Gammaproteobacteria bacterium]
MLQAIRERSQGVIVAIIVGFIILTFALWGIESYIGADQQVVVAEADGEEIYLAEFQDTLQRLRRQAQQMMGESLDDIDWNSAVVRERALDQLVNDRLLDKFVDAVRMRVSDAQLAAQITRIPTFQDENGSFSRQLYQQRLPLVGMSEASFENALRDDMVKAQLRVGVASSEFVTREEAALVERLRVQKRDIGYAIVPASEYADEVVVSDEEVTQHYEANREQYREPERVRLEYLAMSAADLESEIAVDDAALRAYYEANKANYTREEQRNVNHILIQVGEDAAEDEVTAARERAAAALARAREGESFEKLAEELSDDVGSRTEGGETGMFPRGVMAPEFEEAAFALDVGEISEPVRTRFGFHVIKLKAVEPGGLQPFEEVAEQVSTAYRAAEAQKQFFDMAEQFSNLVYEHPDSLDVAGEALDLEVQRSEPMSAADIAREFSDAVAARAFEPEVLVEGLNGEPVELADGRVVAVRVTEHQPSVVPPLADVREAVVEAVRTAKLREKTRAAAEALGVRLREGDSVAEVIEDAGLGWESEDGVGRDSTAVNRAVLREAFRVSVPASGDAAYTTIPIGRADHAVVRVANVQTPAADEVSDRAIADVQQEITTARSTLTWQSFLESLRAGSEVMLTNGP